MKTKYSEIPTYVTKDGSTIRELMHPAIHGNRQQSLAEAIVPPGGRTLPHRHLRSEELYHVTSGAGWMTLAGKRFEIKVGDTVRIDPGVPHFVEASKTDALCILCCCSPPYSHDDTELLDAASFA